MDKAAETTTIAFKPKRKDKDEGKRGSGTTEQQLVAEQKQENCGEPQKKLSRLSGLPGSASELELNSTYQRKEITEWIQSKWAAEQTSDAREETTGAQIYSKPFQICLLPGMLAQGTSKALVDEMIKKVQWSRKQMDLYEFYQSTDLSNMPQCRLLTNFLQVLRKQVRPWLEQVTNLKLDYVSASCSMYTCGDYLLVHDDLLKDRQVAFIYYLSPWEGAEQWTEEQGGCLEIFSSDGQCFPQFPVHRKIAPKDNQFAFFKVGSRSFHQVGEVTTFDYPRLTINGWFHGETNEDFVAESLRDFPRLSYVEPVDGHRPSLNLLLNDVYLKTATRRSIQKRIEENSEICLYEFFKREKFEQARTQLLTDPKLAWRRQGPANAHNYEILDLSTASGTIRELLQLFRSHPMFDLLRDFTDLDLSGAEAVKPSCCVELQRWSHGNYTVLGDGLVSEENTLDLIYYLNASEGAAVITYLSPDAEPPQSSTDRNNVNGSSDQESDDSDSVLLTITPVDNALNIVYRCEGTTKFTKYVSWNTPLDKGSVFVISCSYKE